MRGEGTAGGVSMAWGLATDVGKSRSVNEDSAIASMPVFVVADGMGGHAAGDVASGLVIDRFSTLPGEVLCAVDTIVDTIDEANRQIHSAGLASAETASMGTTAVGLVLVENGPSASWLVFNVGDSRVYRSLGGDLELLSVDHSYVQELVDAGRLSSGEAREHPKRNVVTRALGVEGSVSTDMWVRRPVVGERFLLCSDGLSSEVDDESISTIVGAAAPPLEVAEKLVAAALAAGGRDNVTVLVVDVVAVDADVDEHVTAPRAVVSTAPPVEFVDGSSGSADAHGLPHLEVVGVPKDLAIAPPTAALPEALPVDVIDGIPDWADSATTEPSDGGEQPGEPAIEQPAANVEEGTDS